MLILQIRTKMIYNKINISGEILLELEMFWNNLWLWGMERLWCHLWSHTATYYLGYIFLLFFIFIFTTESKRVKVIEIAQTYLCMVTKFGWISFQQMKTFWSYNKMRYTFKSDPADHFFTPQT